MNSRAILLPLLSTTLAAALHASLQSDIGYTQLKQEYGTALPDGSNLVALQVEAPDAAGNWAVAKSGEMSARKITFPFTTTIPTAYSSHANTVSVNLDGATTSILPALGELKVGASAAYRSSSLKLGSKTGPATVAWDLENHSYIGTLSSATTAIQVLDFRASRDLVTVVAALENATGPMKALWGNAYNTITVGTATGVHNRGGTTLDGVGRMKPDLVGTATYTSYATPIVASSAGLLIAEAKRNTALAAAKDPRVIKALLMAGATKEQFPSWAQTAAQPLDPVYGAGQVSIYNSYKALVSGRQTPGTWGALKGWDTAKTAATSVYYFDVPAGQTLKFSAVLNWHRTLTTSNYTTFVSSLADLNLRLRNATATLALGTIVAESTSTIDNVEHIYRTTLPAGKYALEVAGPAGITYGIAWNGVLAGVVTAPAITAQPVALAVTEGQPASFTVTASGSNLTYQWYKAGLAIPYANSAAYAIAATTLGDASTYSVSVTNSAGTVLSSAAALSVASSGTATTLSSFGELVPVTSSARGQNGTKEVVANLFDHSTATKWLDFSAATWVQITLASPAALSSYSLTSANDYPERDPYNWTVSGSNDGVNWTVIDTRSAQTFASRFLQRDFVLAQPSAAFLYFRFDITCKSGSITQLAELELWGGATTQTEVTTSTAIAELTATSVTARGQNGTKETPAMLVDHNTATKWLDFSATTWVQFAFSAPHSIDSYSFTSANDYPERDPYNWTLSGSNDGVNWTVIDTRSAQTFASRFLQRDFVLPQTSAAFLFFRFDITNKSGSITQLAELELWGR